MNRVYYEGKKGSNEENFIQTILRNNLSQDILENITLIGTDGWTNLKLAHQEFKKSLDEGDKNLIVFDADAPYNKGGFNIRKDEIDKICKDLGYNYHLFLFPNNKDDGNFETLLEMLINPNHKILLDCFSQYENCISSSKNSNGENLYVVPAKKAKIYSYIQAFPKSNSQMEKLKNNGNWNFDNNEYWHIDNSTHINPLVEFFKSHFETIK
jgi:hypothetical protein